MQFNRKSILIFLLFVLTGSMYSSTEYDLKAAFIEKFTRFTVWPDSIEQEEVQFIIGIFGENPFEGALKHIAWKYKIHDKDVAIKFINKVEEISDIHCLFISNTNEDELLAILEKVNGRPILTVSDSDGFGVKGVHINFYETEEGLISFEINLREVEHSGLRMNLLLLEVARILP